jgi:hypothetical protein
MLPDRSRAFAPRLSPYGPAYPKAGTGRLELGMMGETAAHGRAPRAGRTRQRPPEHDWGRAPPVPAA